MNPECFNDPLNASSFSIILLNPFLLGGLFQEWWGYLSRAFCLSNMSLDMCHIIQQVSLSY